MYPLQSPVGDLAEWFFLVGSTLAFGLVATVLWSPFLLAKRLRSLFGHLPPGGHWIVSYVAVTIAASLPYVLGFYAALWRTRNAEAVATANAILDVVVPVSALYLVGVPAIAVIGLPRVDRDWDPTGYGPGTWLLLIAGAAWYAAVFSVPLFFVSFVLALPT